MSGLPTDDRPIPRMCRDCQERFVIEPGEIAFFRRLERMYPTRQIRLPWRCAPCRRARRDAGEPLSPKQW